jgi:hypothetical protein
MLDCIARTAGLLDFLLGLLPVLRVLRLLKLLLLPLLCRVLYGVVSPPSSSSSLLMVCGPLRRPGRYEVSPCDTHALEHLSISGR